MSAVSNVSLIQMYKLQLHSAFFLLLPLPASPRAMRTALHEATTKTTTKSSPTKATTP